MIDSNGALKEVFSVVRVLFQTIHPGFSCICGFVSTGVFRLFSVRFIFSSLIFSSLELQAAVFIKRHL